MIGAIVAIMGKRRRIVTRVVKIERRDGQAFCVRYTLWGDGRRTSEFVYPDGHWYEVPELALFTEYPGTLHTLECPTDSEQL